MNDNILQFPDLPVTDFFDPTQLLDHPDFRTKVRLCPRPGAEETARSWLGGMPQMPADQDWPRGPSGKMAFVAQICCADLPAELWGGIGPREGWLLVFLDAVPFGGEPFSRILHIAETGPARHEGSEAELTFIHYRQPNVTAGGPVLPHIAIDLVELPRAESGIVPSGTARHTMGGLPVTGWHEPDHMTISAYGTPERRKAWASEFDFLGIDPRAEQEVLLFELATDTETGWIWGDVDSSVFRMPRTDLKHHRFDRAALVTTND